MLSVTLLSPVLSWPASRHSRGGFEDCCADASRAPRLPLGPRWSHVLADVGCTRVCLCVRGPHPVCLCCFRCSLGLASSFPPPSKASASQFLLAWVAVGPRAPRAPSAPSHPARAGSPSVAVAVPCGATRGLVACLAVPVREPFSQASGQHHRGIARCPKRATSGDICAVAHGCPWHRVGAGDAAQDPAVARTLHRGVWWQCNLRQPPCPVCGPGKLRRCSPVTVSGRVLGARRLSCALQVVILPF